jgi:hypothetical protein
MELVVLVELVESVEEPDPSEVEVPLPSGGGPLSGGDIVSPIWLNACITLCIRVSFPSEFV